MLFGGLAPPGPAGGAYSAPPDPLVAMRPCQIKHFQTKNTPNVVFCLEPLGELTALPRPTSCTETPHAIITGYVTVERRSHCTWHHAATC